MGQADMYGASALGGERSVGVGPGGGLMAFEAALGTAREEAGPMTVTLPDRPAGLTGTNGFAARLDGGIDRTITSKDPEGVVSLNVTDNHSRLAPESSDKLTPDRMRLSAMDPSSGLPTAHADIKPGSVEATVWPLRAGSAASGSISAGVHMHEVLNDGEAPMVGPAVRASVGPASAQATFAMSPDGGDNHRLVAEAKVPVSNVTASAAYRVGVHNGKETEEVEGKLAISGNPVSGSVRVVGNLAADTAFAEVALTAKTGQNSSLSAKVRHDFNGDNTAGVVDFRARF